MPSVCLLSVKPGKALTRRRRRTAALPCEVLDPSTGHRSAAGDAAPAGPAAGAAPPASVQHDVRSCSIGLGRPLRLHGSAATTPTRIPSP